MQILFAIIPYAFFLGLNSLMVLITRRQFGKCLPLTFITSAFTLLISQVIFETFQIGFYLLIILAILPLLILLYFVVKKEKFKNNLKEFKENYFDKGIIAFTVIYIFFTILDFNRKFTQWDEFSHWGVMIKEMFRTDKFYSDEISTLMVHKDYPPIIQIFELLWTKLCGIYNEMNLEKSLHIFQFSFFIPALCTINKNKEKCIFTILKTLAIVLIAYLSILIFDQHNIINTIYIDYIMVILLAYIVYTIISEKDKLSYFSIFSISISLSFLVLTKQMGIPFFLISIFAYGMDLMFDIKKNREKYKKENKKILKFFVIIICLIVVPLALWRAWGINVDKLQLEQQFKLSDIKVFELPKILKGEAGEDWQIISGDNFINAIKTYNITTSNIHLSFIQSSCICIGFLILFFIINKDKYTNEQKITVILTVLIGIIGYTFVMLNMYVFSFGPIEGPILASFNRYMDTYIIFILSILIMMIANQTDKKGYWIRLLIIIVGLILIQNPIQLKKLQPKFFEYPKNEFELEAEKIRSVVEEDAYVYILGTKENGKREYYIKYYANPIITNVKNYTFDTSDEIDGKDFIKSIQDYILKYKYLYLKSINNDFINKYEFLFKDSNIKIGGIYKINYIDNQIQFELIKE